MAEFRGSLEFTSKVLMWILRYVLFVQCLIKTDMTDCGSWFYHVGGVDRGIVLITYSSNVKLQGFLSGLARVIC